MKECDKRNNHTSSKLHMICISSNNDGHPATKTFNPPRFISCFIPLLLDILITGVKYQPTSY